MDTINGRRILAGGGVAALVLLAGELSIEALFGGPMAWLEELGRPAPGEELVVFSIAMVLAIGTLAVWLYAAIRPRYGAGARTALRVAAAVWVLACLIPESSQLALGLRSARLFWPSVLVSLLSVSLATLAGARLYREAGETVAGVTARRAQPVI